MKRTVLLIATVIASAFVLAVPARATTNVVSDTLYDNGPNYDGRGDINAHGALYQDDVFLVSVQARTPTDPATDPNWIYNSTAVIWDIDVNGDGQSDYWAIVSNFNGVTAHLYSEQDWNTPLCSGSPSYDPTKGIIIVGFMASCIGTPAGFSIQTYFDYSTGGGSASYDLAPNSGFGAPVTRTISSPDPTTTTTTTPPPSNGDPGIQKASTHDGYWMLAADGRLWGFGTASNLGDSGVAGAAHIEPTPSGNGYWILFSGGGVIYRGDAAILGSANLNPGEKAVGLSASPTGGGYWIFTDKGRVLNFGDAQFYGDMSGAQLNGPIVGSVATPSGKGYWLVGSDGGIFSYGDARFHGSTGNLKLNKPVMAMAPSPDGAGYWLVASDGGIFAFDVPFYGSAGNLTLNKPISGMVPGRGGYMMVAQDGGIFSFGNVAFHGSLGANPPSSPIVSVALQP